MVQDGQFMVQDGQLNIRVNSELKRAFIQKAKENGTNATELMVKFMQGYLDDGVSFHPPTNELVEVKSRLAKLEPLESRLAKLERLVLGELAA